LLKYTKLKHQQEFCYGKLDEEKFSPRYSSWKCKYPLSNFTSSSIAAVLPVGKQVGLDYLLSQV